MALQFPNFDPVAVPIPALHLGGLQLFVCNLPDIFISAGAVLLFLDMLLEKPAVETAL